MPLYNIKNVVAVWVNGDKEVVGPCCIQDTDVISNVVAFDEKDKEVPFVVCDRCKKLC